MNVPVSRFPGFAVDQLLVQRVSDPGGHAADHLPVHDYVVDDGAAVLHADVLVHFYHTCFPVNADKSQVRPVAECLVWRVEGARGLKSPLDTLRK